MGKQSLQFRRYRGMETQTVTFTTVKKNGVITKIGRSTILQPKPIFKGGAVKWYDDSKLLKAGRK